MSTRGAFGVKLNGKYYITYNHGDSYPEGLGRDIIDFIKNILIGNEKLSQFIENFKNIKLVKFDDKPSKKDQKYYTDLDFYNNGVSSGSKEDWYCLLHEIQGIETFDKILDGSLNHFIDNFDFLRDSLFCEYAYIIDLDCVTIEFYKGFNKNPDSNSSLPVEQKTYPETEYYPVKFQGSCPLNKIPKNWIKKFYPEN